MTSRCGREVCLLFTVLSHPAAANRPAQRTDKHTRGDIYKGYSTFSKVIVTGDVPVCVCVCVCVYIGACVCESLFSSWPVDHAFLNAFLQSLRGGYK